MYGNQQKHSFKQFRVFRVEYLGKEKFVHKNRNFFKK